MAATGSIICKAPWPTGRQLQGSIMALAALNCGHIIEGGWAEQMKTDCADLEGPGGTEFACLWILPWKLLRNGKSHLRPLEHHFL